MQGPADQVQLRQRFPELLMPCFVPSENEGAVFFVDEPRGQAEGDPDDDIGKIADELPLEIAGLMSHLPIGEFESRLQRMIKKAHDMGVSAELEPFMSLSFLALVVIPELKITDRGLFDVKKFAFTPIEAEG